jgi:hypothetical protein
MACIALANYGEPFDHPHNITTIKPPSLIRSRGVASPLIVPFNDNNYVTVLILVKGTTLEQNVESCYWPVKFTYPIGNALAGVTLSANNFRTT